MSGAHFLSPCRTYSILQGIFLHRLDGCCRCCSFRGSLGISGRVGSGLPQLCPWSRPVRELGCICGSSGGSCIGGPPRRGGHCISGIFSRFCIVGLGGRVSSSSCIGLVGVYLGRHGLSSGVRRLPGISV